MPRTVKEWIGKTDDSPIPPRVKLRIAERSNYTCALCTRGAKPGNADHKIALILGGENRETNLQWLCIPCHRAKTNTDVAYKARAAETKKRVAGVKPKSPWSKRLEAYEYDWKLKRYVPKRDLEETQG